MPITVNSGGRGKHQEDSAEELRGVVVPGYGRAPNDVMFIGEAPGATEARRGRPFCGRSGEEQARYCQQVDFNIRSVYMTNVVKEFTPGNPDPTPTQIQQWTPVLHEEILRVNPRVIVAVGRFAANWCLGGVDWDTMRAIHGIPRPAANYDNTIVVPVFHPASGFYDDDNRTLIAHDYRAMADIVRRARLGHDIDIVRDEFEGRENYRDVTGAELAAILSELDWDNPLGLDTEGYPGNPWSVQIATEPGNGFTLRREQPDFHIGIAALQRHVNGRGESKADKPWLAIHNGMHDVDICRECGLELFNARLWDSMYAAYIMRTEPQALKLLSYRWVGMKMRSYEDTVGPVGIELQLDYLLSIISRSWPKPEERIIHENDGTFKLYKPQPIERRAEAIVADWYSEKLDKEGNRVDPMKRWKKCDRELRLMVEREIGPMPIGTLAHIPLDEAVYYASRDPDATLRLMFRLQDELRRRNPRTARSLELLMSDGMDVLPIFEEMQSSGMPGRRAKFQALSDRMIEKKQELQARISHRYFDGRPFNPNSSDQVATIMRRRGLVGEKRTKSGKVSTGKKSIEHLRHVDEAIADIIDWREHDKIDSSFCQPALERLGDQEYAPVRCTIKTTRVATRRVAAADPNLTAIPVRHELGKEVRDCYEAEEGYVFGSWDLSQIEMRYMAHVSKDKLLIRFFGDSRLDVHSETAARIFGLKIYEDADNSKDRYRDINEMAHRYPSKRAGFGIITNISGPGLLDQLRMFGCKGWDEQSCTKLIKEWLRVYEGVAKYLNDSKDEAHRYGVVYDCWGMPRFLPGVYSSDRGVVGEAERAASSHKISGGAQGLLQRAMAWLRDFIWSLRVDAGLDVRWVLQIHDEVILRFKEDLWDVINPLVVEGLTLHSMKLDVPIKCSGSKSRSWGKLK